MARYQVAEQGWPLGPYVIPPGTVLDTAIGNGKSWHCQNRRRSMQCCASIKQHMTKWSSIMSYMDFEF